MFSLFFVFYPVRSISKKEFIHCLIYGFFCNLLKKVSFSLNVFVSRCVLYTNERENDGKET